LKTRALFAATALVGATLIPVIAPATAEAGADCGYYSLTDNSTQIQIEDVNCHWGTPILYIIVPIDDGYQIIGSEVPGSDTETITYTCQGQNENEFAFAYPTSPSTQAWYYFYDDCGPVNGIVY
jgi:hypothetical protein